jgi:hypothetical protein
MGIAFRAELFCEPAPPKTVGERPSALGFEPKNGG